MKDQIDFLQRRGIDAARLDSSLDAAEQRAIFERLAQRLAEAAVRRAGALQQRALPRPARADADRAVRGRRGALHLRVGHNFRPDYLKLAERARELGAERVLALTATATPAVVADIRAGLRHRGSGRRRHRLLPAEPDAADDTGHGRRARRSCCVERLRERPPGSTIVYVTLQRTALRVAELLAAAGLPARPYHAGMSTEDRVAVQEWWSALARRDRRRDDRLRDGDRQGGRPLRLPLQPAEEPRVVLAGDRPGRPRRRRRASASCSRARTTCRRSRTSPTATRRRARRSRACSRRCSGTPSARSSRSRSTSSPCATTCARSCSGRPSPTWSSTACSGRGRLLRRLPAAAARRRVARGRLPPLRRSRAGFLRRLVASGKTGRTWTTLAPDDAAAELGEERRRIVAALDYLDAAGPRRAAAGRAAPALHARRARRRAEAALVDRLLDRFARRERAETGADPERARARHARRLPGRALVGVLRRDPHRAVRALQLLPDRKPADASPSRSRSRRSRRP